MSTVGPGLPPLSPTREEFHALAGRGNLVPVFAELAADLDTPLSAFLRLRPGPYAFLLESVEGGEKWARYSFLGSDPLMVFTAKGKRISVRRADGTTELLLGTNPFAALRELLSQFKPVPVPGLPRFQGGAVGFLSYDMIRHVERLPVLAKDRTVLMGWRIARDLQPANLHAGGLGRSELFRCLAVLWSHGLSEGRIPGSRGPAVGGDIPHHNLIPFRSRWSCGGECMRRSGHH